MSASSSYDSVSAASDDSSTASHSNGELFEALAAAVESGAQDDAASAGAIHVVQWLVEEQGVDPDAVVEGETALDFAASAGSMDVVTWLVKSAGARIDGVDGCDQTPLATAAGAGHIDIVQWLVENGADVNLARNNHYTALMSAMREESTEIVEWLLDQANVDAAWAFDGSSALTVAAKTNKLEIVQRLALVGCPLESPGSGSGGAIVVAADSNAGDVVKWLVSEKQVRVDAADACGETALHKAARWNYLDILECLATSGSSNVNAANERGETPLHAAVDNGSSDAVEWLVRTGRASLDVRNNDGETALMAATKRNRWRMIYGLVEGGADVNVADADGRFPLHVAAENGRYRVVDALASASGVDLDVVDADGKTPLHVAAEGGESKVVEHLLRHGASSQVADNSGVTPLQAAEQAGFDDLAALLAMAVSDRDAALAAVAESANYRRLDKVMDGRGMPPGFGGSMLNLAALFIIKRLLPLYGSGWLALFLAVIGTAMTFGLPRTVHDSGVNIWTSVFFLGLCIITFIVFVAIELVLWRTWSRGLSALESGRDRRLLIFLYAAMVATLRQANALVLSAIMYEVDVRAIGNVIVSFVLIFGVNTLLSGYFSVLTLHDYDLFAVVVVFAAVRHIGLVMESFTFGEANVSDDAWIFSVALPAGGVIVLLAALAAMWMRPNFSALHLFDPFSVSFLEVTLFGSCMPRRAPFYDPNTLLSGASLDASRDAGSGSSSSSSYEYVYTTTSLSTHGGRTSRPPSDSSLSDAIPDGSSSEAASDRFGIVSTSSAPSSSEVTTSTSSHSSSEQEERISVSSMSAGAERDIRSPHELANIHLASLRPAPRYDVAITAMTLGKPVAPGYHWNLPLLRRPGSEVGSKLPPRCDGVHLMRSHYSWTTRSIFACSYLAIISVLYFSATLILMAALYRVCPIPTNESRMLSPPPPLPASLLHPADNVPLSQLRMLGTHNSYHLAPRKVFPGFNQGARFWRYSHKPLIDQLALGVRAFELDPHVRSESISVWHVNIWDDFSLCPCFVTCLRVFREWSRDHPGHVPIIIQLEFKSLWFADLVAGINGVHLDSLVIVERDILRIIGRNAIFTPDDLRNGSATLPDALAANSPPGWPRLGALRNKFIFILDDASSTRAAYLAPSLVLRNRIMFTTTVDGEAVSPWTSVFKYNSPLSESGAKIAELVTQGFLVRTRADTEDLSEQVDEKRAIAANDSMAQIVSFDWTPEIKWASYFSPSLLACIANATVPCSSWWEWEL
ncbi:uncharacterized protein AMSG_11997 [Thecamonas trahens ATCC 50062]|uniref:Uncharacterized protein n=1 Tax=Thecamonas trahens ATCC 50062 TaxID=461836 RepID=A0A0L0DES8_THETB|nr:hypothetical protein AMSG_11997 [Thecamonas trahens ATCC 50062]KNC50725.1 hypothetical protein AMSG_11997 [Thecamonas trahens ATCC 50062]|eukprot:XP_013756818.1 hypothetical protein AMSG_11997 [Thecamonas trahens ATCC 50062]